MSAEDLKIIDEYANEETETSLKDCLHSLFEGLKPEVKEEFYHLTLMA